MNLNDQNFINNLKNRQQYAVEYIVHEYHKILTNAAYGQKFSDKEVEDVVQATWQALFESIGKFEGRSHIRTFLFGIFYNKCKERWRDNKKYVTLEEFDTIVDSSYNKDGHWTYEPKDPETLVNAGQIFEKIEECMDGLAPKQRLAFHLKEVVGESTLEICNILGVSDTNLRVLLYRGKNRLRKCLEGYSINSTL